MGNYANRGLVIVFFKCLKIIMHSRTTEFLRVPFYSPFFAFCSSGRISGELVSGSHHSSQRRVSRIVAGMAPLQL